MSEGVRVLLLSAVLAGIVPALVGCHQVQQVQVGGDLVLSQSDQNFISGARRLETRDRALGTLVKGKSASPEITKFADTVVRNESDALQRLEVMVYQYKFRAAAVPTGEQFSEDSKMKKLSRKALERQFVNVMLKDDEHAIDLLQEEARSQGDMNLRQYATDLLPVFRTELKNTQDLQEKVSPAVVRKGGNGKRKANRTDHASL
jgi:uncharacterized protein (DUF305 family)